MIRNRIRKKDTMIPKPRPKLRRKKKSPNYCRGSLRIRDPRHIRGRQKRSKQMQGIIKTQQQKQKKQREKRQRSILEVCMIQKKRSIWNWTKEVSWKTLGQMQPMQIQNMEFMPDLIFSHPITKLSDIKKTVKSQRSLPMRRVMDVQRNCRSESTMSKKRIHRKDLNWTKTVQISHWTMISSLLYMKHQLKESCRSTKPMIMIKRRNPERYLKYMTVKISGSIRSQPEVMEWQRVKSFHMVLTAYIRPKERMDSPRSQIW